MDAIEHALPTFKDKTRHENLISQGKNLYDMEIDASSAKFITTFHAMYLNRMQYIPCRLLYARLIYEIAIMKP